MFSGRTRTPVVLLMLPCVFLSAMTARAQTKQAERDSFGDVLRRLQATADGENARRPVDRNRVEMRFDAQGADFGAWTKDVGAQLQRNWVIPLAGLQELRQPDNAVFRLSVGRDGTIADVTTVQVSPVEALTRAAAETITRVGRIGPLPAAYPDQVLPVTLTFRHQPLEREYIFTGSADFSVRPESGAFESLSADQIKREGLRFFVLGADTFDGRLYANVRVTSRSGAEAVGWMTRVPTSESRTERPSQNASSPSPTSSTSNAVRVDSTIRPPAKTKHVNPVYPMDAQTRFVQGIVIVEATIDTRGKVAEVVVVRSIPLLDAAALNAVRQWEFTPTLLDGKPVAVIMTATVMFSLK